MASPYSSQSASNYNANPPSDEGSATSANRVLWSTIKTKLNDPVKTLADAINSALVTAFGKTTGSAGITSTAISYSVVGSDQGKVIRATASGVTITCPDATNVTAPFSFSVLNNSTGSITIAGYSGQTVDGASTVSIPSGAGVSLETDGANFFSHGQNFLGTVSMPQGRLTLTSGTPVLSSDVSAAAAVLYTPYVGNLIPIYTGSLFTMRTFSELTLTLQANSNYAANAIYDAFIFDSSGTVTIGIGPAWSTATAGSGARGTGAGTTELQRVNGLWTNKVSMTARNAGSTYTVAANQGTYVGSIFMDGTNGQVSYHVTYGQSRKIGIWNAYNRVPVILKAGDATASWAYATNTIRASNNSSANSLTLFSGLAEESYDVQFAQMIGSTNTVSCESTIGIGWNVTNAYSGLVGEYFANSQNSAAVRPKYVAPARYIAPGAIGIQTVTALEKTITDATNTFYGTEASMLLTGSWQA